MKKTTQKQLARRWNLMPQGVPRYVRIYDDASSSLERYTVCFTGNYQRHLWKDGKTTEQRPGFQGRLENFPRPRRFIYISLNENASAYHGEHTEQIDVNKNGFAPMIGRRNHLGVRIAFKDLPKDCRKLVLSEYKELWGLP